MVGGQDLMPRGILSTEKYSIFHVLDTVLDLGTSLNPHEAL